MIRVQMPHHLRTLAQVQGEVTLQLAGETTTRQLLDALEQQFPTLQGTMRDHATGKRRPMVRFYACQRDISHESLDAVLPADVLAGQEPFLIVGALSGG